jgi:hypothetical protein
MGKFFDSFPLTRYSISNFKYPDYYLVTNILFRTAIIKEVLSNSSSYIQYVVRDGDTPDILAAKIYDDPEAHWIILYANDMIDPQYDWPLTTSTFYNYMVDKYRTAAEEDIGNPLEDYEVIAWTQDLTNPNSFHHYEKVVKQVNTAARVESEVRYVVNKSKLTDNTPTVPFDYYDDLADEQDVVPIDLDVDGQTVIQTIYRNAVTYYDYESELNETKRNIKIIKKEFYPQVIREFDAITRNSRFTSVRDVV